LQGHITQCQISGFIKNVRDKNQFLYLARQAYPENPESLYRAYLEATDRPHSYFILDFAQDTSSLVRFRTGVFPDEQTTVNAPDETYKVQLSRTSASPKLRYAIISNCNNELLNAISEIALNVLHGNIELPVTSRQKLRKHKTALLALADKRRQLRRSAVKRRVLNQREGFLLPLLGAVLPTIASLLFK
jgi:hypothetical protein